MAVRKILITGTDMGLGAAMTEAALAHDYVVYSCLYKKTTPAMEQLKAKYKDNLFVVEDVDIGSDSSVAEAVKTISARTDFLDVIVNNGAINPDNFKSKLEELDFNLMQTVLNVNSLGALRVTKGFIGLLRRGYLKTLVNVSSEAGSITNSFRITGYDYNMSKSALNMASSMLQTYLKPEGIKVLAVFPGWLQTVMGGPGAILAPIEAANRILKLIMDYQGKFNAPVFMDNEGNKMDW